ncbi:hypothetical protein MOX02_28240 [Methylobacterium oxalidis]|uniref:Uncharacterized protein n=1 Tax=Methylobacterium oxalidis TaxID=944322 RepID=A0A512J4A1_9HYPH|nr:hypothetical protein [Methylobacterium oxalidis]GEP04786.1 hypothetical protein MOX02_28240 [Methylobacterium oxalidis]
MLELLDRGLLRPEAVARLVDNYIAAPELRTHTLVLGLVLDVAAALQAYPLAGAVLASSLVSSRVKRSTVGTAILLARPRRV